MALFSNLHHVSEVLVRVISDHVGAMPTGGIHSGEPLENPGAASEQIRITLLYVTPQASHRNDAWEKTPAGTLAPPPLTLSAFFLVTTYGTATNEEPVRAHELLGNVMQAFHTVPEVRLPLATLPSRGEGPLAFVQVPMTPELMEKVYMPLQAKHRPWVLYEVSPVQLAMDTAALPGAPVVRPGGLRLGDVRVSSQPLITRVTPDRQVQGGRVRVDVELHGQPLTQLHVGGKTRPVASLTALSEQSFVVDLPAAGPSAVSRGIRDIHLQTGDAVNPPILISDPVQVEVLGADSATVAAPQTLSHDLGTPLQLEGAGLATATEVLVWPDVGVAAPSDIRSLAVASAAAGSVQVSAAALAAASLVTGVDHRVSVKVGPHRYTPYVLLRFHA
ncbi:DUF4255 domain-containing protein [Pyxidicoccus fallax]|uniref:DUF4255 domain-containing protein n=1 Tax=Pyxidicoccus fallax TaxID=394095 RepID=A0A848LWB9_9BACT|nr:DUF4255 domain-containing protein [Pyxidicoccus fallax]NPC83316.1 DUF4255 domain-containing protein [Pyxidicoccus fallax]